MSALPQLVMRNPDITRLPMPALKDGWALVRHSESPGMESLWEAIIESAFDRHFAFDFLINAGNYNPEHVLYLTVGGKPVATTTAVENDNYPNEGWFRMVGVHKDAQGTGAGRAIALAALHDLRARGYKSAMLSTDDRRIPAISLYLSLGFEPVYSHESHEARWKTVLEEINWGRKP